MYLYYIACSCQPTLPLVEQQSAISFLILIATLLLAFGARYDIPSIVSKLIFFMSISFTSRLCKQQAVSINKST